MFNKNTKKGAFLSSLVALVLCCSMFVGTTFAWFTDEVKSGTNVIAAGNLDVELYHSKTNDFTGENKVDGQTALFTDKDGNEIKNWEPGVVAYSNFQVANVGTLALKYQFSVNFSNMNYVEVEGKQYSLADALQVAVVKGEAFTGDRDDAKKLTGWKSLADFALSGELEGKTTSETYGIVIYWPDNGDFDNIFNLNNGRTTTDDKETLTIDLGIHLFATQEMYENDSFGNDYDKDTPDTVVSTATELAAAIANIEDGGIIGLAANVTFDEDSVYVLNNYKEGLYYEGDKSFTIDLGGYTIADDGTVNDYLLLFKNTGSKANTITIKNGSIVTADNAYSAICTSGGSTQQITINLEDVAVSNTRTDGYGDVIRARGGAVVNVNDGAVITGEGVYVTAYAVGATVNIYDGAEIYMNETTSYVGAVVGASNGGTVNAYGGYGKGTQGCFIAMTTGGTINVSGGEWIADCNNTGNDGNYSVLIAQNSTYETYWAAKSIINVTGGTFSGKYNCYGVAAGDSMINISGGTFTVDPTDPTDYVADGYKAVGDDSNGYTVYPENAIVTATELVAAIAKGGEVTLSADIAVTSPLSITANTVIDGNGNTLTYTGANRAIEIANNADYDVDVTIKNLTVDCSAGYCQRGINYNDNGTLTLDNVTVKGDNVTYGINLPGKSFGATVVINGGSYSANIALNVWGANSVVTANDVEFITVDNTESEGYAAVKLNNDGTTSAEGAVITINGGSITVTGSYCDDSDAVTNATSTGVISISSTTTVDGKIVEGYVSVVRYPNTDNFYSHTSLQNSVKCVEETNSGWIELLTDISVDSLEVNEDVTIKTNGHALTVNSYSGSGTLTVDGTVVYGN